MKPLRIGMVTACYKPVTNGVTRMIALYKQELERLGHEVTIFTLGTPDPAGEEAGVLRSPGIPLGDTGYYLGFGYRRDMRRRVSEMDILHCHHLFMSLELAYRYGICPIVYTNHTRYDLYTGAYTPLAQPASDSIMRQIWPEFTDLCDLVIAPSEGILDVMRSFGVRTSIKVVPNGVDLSRFHDPPGEVTRRMLNIAPEAWPVLIYTGRLAAEKQLDQLLPQFAVLREHLVDAHLLLVGAGAAQQELMKQAAELGLDDSVHFVGLVPYDAVPDYLNMSDIFVTPSVSEVHPLTVIEAMASGLPVVGVKSPGVGDIVVTGETGLLTSTPLGLAAAIVANRDNRAQWQAWGQRGRLVSGKYDIRNTARQTLDLYDQLLRGAADTSGNRSRAQPFKLSRQLQHHIEQLGRLLKPDETKHGPSA